MFIVKKNARAMAAVLLAVLMIFACIPEDMAHATAKQPAVPQITRIVATKDSIEVKWSRAARAREYEVWIRTKEESYWLAGTSRKRTMRIDTGQKNTTYYVKVRGISRNFTNGKFSPVKHIRTKKKKSAMVRVPNLIGKGKGEARDTLKNAGLLIGKESKKAFTIDNGKFEDGEICGYSPKGRVRKGTKINVIYASVPVKDSAEGQAALAEKYDYDIRPVLAPFCVYFFVTTSNPYVRNVRFTGETEDGSDLILEPVTKTYADIDYYDKDSLQVKKNIYLFEQTEGWWDVSATTLTLEATGNGDQYGDDYISTPKQLEYPSGLESATDYLIHTYADPVDGDLFAKLDAVQEGLEKLAVYPKDVFDRSDAADSYPSLCVSPYKEMSLNRHTEIYPESEEALFSEDLYPFVLDSLGFPRKMRAVALKLDGDCTVQSGNNHWEIDVTYHGETKTYGGQGEGNSYGIYSDLITKDYHFDGADLLLEGMTGIRKQYLNYGAESAVYAKKLTASLSNKEIAKTIGTGAWLRVGVEGSDESAYAYETVIGTGDKTRACSMEDCWVDGRYINRNNRWETGAAFSDHPTADIVLRNQAFTDADGKKRTGDLWYEYDQDTNCWRATFSYAGATSFPVSLIDKAPKLTADEADALDLDRNTDTAPQHGYVYDGSASPGTAF